jgi:prepilin-type N-terminal cleavage/methylation domain-containing protein
MTLSWRRLRRADEGMTLIELVVAMVLLGVVGAVAAAGVLSAFQDQRRERSRLDAISSSQRAFERMAKDVRAADPLVAGDATTLTVLVYHGTSCQQRRYYINASKQLVQDISTYANSTSCRTKTGVPGTASSHVLAQGVLNDATKPLFSYQRIDPAQDALVAVTTPVSTTVVGLVNKVTVNLNIGLKFGQQPVTLTNAVDLRNVERNS